MTAKDVDLLEGDIGGGRRGLGVLSVIRGSRKARLPLTAARIEARAADRIAHVTVTQTFRNPFPEALEAVYVFPLGGGSAVSSFELRVGSRVIQGLVKERGAARRDYEAALDAGRRAALLEEDRDDVFTVKVGNLPPGEEAAVKIAYSEMLPFHDDGTTELRLPLVVAPRYIPGSPLSRDPSGDGTEWDTDDVPDASRITPPRLAPGFDPAVHLSIEVELAGGEVSGLASSQHAVRLSGGKITLSRANELLDRDFVLRWRLAGDRVRSTLLVHRGPDGASYGVLSIIPPARKAAAAPRDVVFVLDRSGSMEGIKMASASRACAILLRSLGPADRFGIVAFDEATEWLGRELLTADEAGIERGAKFLRQIEARGGTELSPALGEALGALDARRETTRQPLVVLLTDGQVGNESEVLKLARKQGAGARIFTVGIDTAVNEAFLRKLAAAGGGTATCVPPGNELEEALRGVALVIGEPLAVGLEVDGARDLAPRAVPDLFAGRAVSVFVRPDGESVRVRGKLTGGGLLDETITATELSLPAIGQLWARARVQDLEDRFRAGDDVRQEIVDLSVRHSILTRFTAFVVVDEEEVVNPDGTRRKVVQPAHVPAEWLVPEDTDSGRVRGAFSPVSSLLYSAPRIAHAWDFGTLTSHAEPVPPSQLLGSCAGRLLGNLMSARTRLEAGSIPDTKPIRDAMEDLQASLKPRRKHRAIIEVLGVALAELLTDMDEGRGSPGELLARLDGVLERLREVLEKAFPGALPATGGGQPFWEESI